MLLIIVYVMVLIIYMACPLLGKLVIMGLNFFIPDPLPAIDEVVMVIGFLSNLGKVVEYFEGIEEVIVSIPRNITRIGKNAFKGISVKAKIKVSSSKLKAYKKLLRNKGQGKKVKITK